MKSWYRRSPEMGPVKVAGRGAARDTDTGTARDNAMGTPVLSLSFPLRGMHVRVARRSLACWEAGAWLQVCGAHPCESRGECTCSESEPVDTGRADSMLRTSPSAR